MDWLYVLKFQVCSFDNICGAIYNGLWRFQSHSTTLFCCAAGGFSDRLGNFERRAILASRSFEQMPKNLCHVVHLHGRCLQCPVLLDSDFRFWD